MCISGLPAGWLRPPAPKTLRANKHLKENLKRAVCRRQVPPV